MITLLVLLISLIELRFGSALFQEERPLFTLYTVMKLEFSDNDFELVNDTSQGKRYVSKTPRDNLTRKNTCVTLY